MRIIIIAIILILAAAGLYTAYGVLTFEAEKPRPLVFTEPTPESLQALGVLPKDDQTAVVLSTEQQQQTQKAVAKISDAITEYQKLQVGVPLRLKGTLETVNSAIASGRMPAYFLSTKDNNGIRKYEILDYDTRQITEAPSSPASLTCSESTSIFLGNDGNDSLTCANGGRPGDQIFIGGPGNDVISDAAGNRIINPGSGDDTITLGPGRTIIVLDEVWGHDTLTVDCTGADIQPGEAATDFPVPWVSPYMNFIVLNPRISKGVVQWNGNVLTNTESGDTLSISQNCFTLIEQ